ncbi:MAG: hypothetical protein U9O78_01755 [Patescibacteria group bacterium]|nr:hypothetical protein [Patescibacteria group bacterium]
MENIIKKPKNYFSQAWEIFQKKWKFLYKAFLIILLVQIVVSLLGCYYEENTLQLVSLMTSLAGSFLNLIMSMGLTILLLRVVRNEDASISQLFDVKQNILVYIWASVRVNLIVIAGFILLVIPGIIWGIKYSFVQFLVIDKRVKAKEAMKMSAKMTEGIKGKIFVFGLFSFFVNLLGFLAFGVGLLISIPVSYLAFALLYNSLLPRIEAKQN